MQQKQKPTVYGSLVDDETRCKHYQSSLDIIALKFKCCQAYYPCYECHEEHAGHEAQQWETDERDTKAVLCGVCGHEMTINQYMVSENICPSCGAAFNPGCRVHYHLYFR